MGVGGASAKGDNTAQFLAAITTYHPCLNFTRKTAPAATKPRPISSPYAPLTTVAKYYSFPPSCSMHPPPAARPNPSCPTHPIPLDAPLGQQRPRTF